MLLDLSIILVNWNSLGYLKDCLESICEHTHGVTFEFIVVDNASTENGLETLYHQFPGIEIIKSEENLGFAGANNLGFLKSRGSHVLFLNPDTKLIGPSIPILLEFLKSTPDAGIVGCRLLNTDLSVQTSCIQKFPTILNQLFDIEFLRLMWPKFVLWEIAPLFKENGAPVQVEVVSGACMLMKRHVFERAGKFSDEYFMYAEDLDLCYKVIKLGYRNYYVGSTSIVHHGGKSSDQKVSEWATTMKSKAVMQFCVKTRGKFYAMLYRCTMGIAACLRLLFLALAFPIGILAGARNSIRTATAKWSAILKWAMGR